jgi:hypothetical protein
MYYYFDIKKQIRRIFKNKAIFKIKQNKSDDIIDTDDGAIYKEILQTTDGKMILNKKAFTFSLNSDGISVSSSSNKSIWPVYLTINEILPEKRFNINNVIVAGTTSNRILFF